MSTQPRHESRDYRNGKRAGVLWASDLEGTTYDEVYLAAKARTSGRLGHVPARAYEEWRDKPLDDDWSSRDDFSNGFITGVQAARWCRPDAWQQQKGMEMPEDLRGVLAEKAARLLAEDGGVTS